jgi:hypothetical protein
LAYDAFFKSAIALEVKGFLEPSGKTKIVCPFSEIATGSFKRNAFFLLIETHLL